MSNVVVYQNDEELRKFAVDAVKSGIYRDIKDASSAIVRIQMGREFGLGPAASLKSIQLIQGNPTFSAHFIAGLIKRSKPRYNYLPREYSSTKCVIEFYEDGVSVGSWEYTLAEAKAAGLADKEVWKKYPKSMLFCRALTAGARVFCPDLANFPFYTSEELGGEPSPEDVLLEDYGNARASYVKEPIVEAELVEVPTEPKLKRLNPAKYKPVEVGEELPPLPEPEMVKKISASQLVSIEDRYNLLSLAADRKIDLSKVCKHLGIDSVEGMSQEQYGAALKFVGSKVK